MNFYEHIETIIGKEEKDILFDSIKLEQIKCLRVNTLYYSNESLKNTYPNINENENIDYSMLNVVDLVLIDAFLVLINAIKNKQLGLVDFYKLVLTEYNNDWTTKEKR